MKNYGTATHFQNINFQAQDDTEAGKIMAALKIILEHPNHEERMVLCAEVLKDKGKAISASAKAIQNPLYKTFKKAM